ncbi:MAG: hypothetical protein ACRCXX_13800 [Cetobacterium sp.]|uniref:hypothetical protein n=1 Tax=Cetobacterium sp. TaxID=2071632 RepID=UPI003F34576D
MNTKILRKKLNNFLDTTECGLLSLSGTKLSVADCETLILYCDAIDNGTTYQLMKPLGSTAKVLEAHNLKYWGNN